MSETFNNLISIVNRTKKIDDGSKAKTRATAGRTIRRAPAEIDLLKEDEDEFSVPKVTPKSTSVVKSKMFDENSAISKLLGGKVKATRPVTVEKKEEPEIVEEVEEVVEEKPKKTTAKKPTTKKPATKTATKKKSTAKKSTKSTSTKSTKSTTKKTEVKKDEEKKTKNARASILADKIKSISASKTSKPTVKPVPVSNIDRSDPMNEALYQALHSTLYEGGTDISDYIEEEKTDLQASALQLQKLKAEKENRKLNEEISKEQQEYEKLFTGSFGAGFGEMQKVEEGETESEVDEEYLKYQESLKQMDEQAKIEEEEKKNPNDRKKIYKDAPNILAEAEDIPEEKQPEDPVQEISEEEAREIRTHNTEIEQKIADYYKRKQEKIDQYNAEEDEPEITSTFDNRLSEYEEIFGGKMFSRAEILSNNNSEETTTQEDTEETIEESNQSDIQEEIKSENENQDTELETNSNSEDELESQEITENSEEIKNEDSVMEEIAAFHNDDDDEIVQYIASESSSEDSPVAEENSENTNEESENVEEESTQEQEEEKVEEQTDKETEDKMSDEDMLQGLLGNNETKKESVITKVSNDDFDYDDDELDRYDTRPLVESYEQETIPEEVEEEYTATYDEYIPDEVDDYIIESSVSEITAEEPKVETVGKSMYIDEGILDDDLERNDIVVDEKPTEEEFVVDSESQEKESQEEDDTLSRSEFYNEMQRLQESLMSELKGRPQQEETEVVDLFAEPEVEEVEEEIVEEETDDQTVEEKKEFINDLLDHIIEEKQEEERLENIKQAENDGLDLLHKSVGLNEEDLKFEEESTKPRNVDGSAFYFSNEYMEEKANDEYLNMYNDEMNGVVEKEMGDINLNKDIHNAISLKDELELAKEIAVKEKTENEENNEDSEVIEAIYTLFGMERKKVKMEKENMKILYVASECQPFIATGGLGDVAGSLPKAMAKKDNVDVRVIIPLYGDIKAEYRDKFEYIGNFTVHLSWRQEYCGLFKYFADGVTYYFIDNERYFKRSKAYGFYDDGERFAYFCKAVVECLPMINFFPDIINCNDWQTALVSTYIKTGNWSDYRYYRIKNVYTIHNVEYQGVYGMENLKDLFGIDPRFKCDMEYNGDINLTKAAIQFSDKFTTVSDSYCDNLKQPYCSRGLHHIIIRNEYKLSGILNGIDMDFYNPATDKNLVKNFSVDTMEDKVMNKKIWQDEIGLPVDGDTPMIAIVSRLVSHKGLDLVTKIIENVLQKDIQLVVVGTGDQRFVDYFKYLENKYPTKVRAFVDKYSNEIARKAYGASDIFLMPSKIEPCGISQMISSRYGSIPIVREVGGLKDSITDFGCEGGGNGYTFTNYNPNDLQYQLERAIADYADKPNWKKKMKICMERDFSWDKSAEKYLALYESLMK